MVVLVLGFLGGVLLFGVIFEDRPVGFFTGCCCWFVRGSVMCHGAYLNLLFFFFYSLCSW